MGTYLESSGVGSVLIQLLPLIVGSVLMPTWVLIVLVLLSGNRGLAEAAASVSGITLVRLVQGVIFGVVYGASEHAHAGNEQQVVVSTLLLIAGILMWAAALKQVFGGEDAGNPAPKLMSMVSALTPLKAMGLGALLVMTSSRAWIFTLAALGVIGQAELGYAWGVTAFLLYVLGAELLLIAPILMYTRSSAWLDAATLWLEHHNRPVVIAVSLVVGSFFLWRGITGLVG